PLYSLRVWDTATGSLLLPFTPGSKGDFSPFAKRPRRNVRLAFSPDGKWLAASQNDKGQELVLFDVETGKPFPSLWKEADKFAFTPDGKILAAGTRSGPVVLYDLAGKKKVCEIVAGSRWRAPRFGPDGKTIAMLHGGSIPFGKVDPEDGEVAVWDA